jgi:hypothetical protein
MSSSSAIKIFMFYAVRSASDALLVAGSVDSALRVNPETRQDGFRSGAAGRGQSPHLSESRRVGLKPGRRTPS